MYNKGCCWRKMYDSQIIKCIVLKRIGFDTFSPHPSAMYRMEGFLEGLPKVLTSSL